MNDRSDGAIQKILAGPAISEGGRHTDGCSRLLQLRANGMERNEAIAEMYDLYPVGSGQHRKIRPGEWEEAWNGLDGKLLTPTSTHLGRITRKNHAKPQPRFEPTGESEPLPSNLSDTSPIDFLAQLYGREAYICITWADADGKPTKNIVHTVEDWHGYYDKHSEEFSAKEGVWFCVNPLQDHESERKGNQVADFRYCLVEADSRSLEEQLANLRASGLPIAATYKSGHKSIHALVAIDAGTDAKLYAERVAKVYSYLEHLPGLDFHNKEPNRLSRLPGGYREETNQRQALLTWGIGHATFKEWETDVNRRKLQGQPLAELVHKEPNEADTLLGNRYLCRGGGMLIVAPSGHGKSVLSIQAAIQWSVNDVSFGIKPAKALRTLIVQAEDDEGDCIEMAQIARHLNVTGKKFELFRKNVWLELVNDLTGVEFLQAVDGFLEQWPADVVIINPLEAYLGEDTKDKKAISLFLRNWLNPVLTKHNCAAIIIHHTPKTNFRDTSKWKASDWMYSGSGDAGLTNWARAILVIDPTEMPGTYKFIGAKRGKRIGWGDPFSIYETYWSHSRDDGKLLWVPATEAEIKSAAENKKNVGVDTFIEIIPVVEPISKVIIRKLAKDKWGLGRDRCDDLLKEALEAGKVSEKSFPRKGTNPEKKYTRNRDFTGQESLLGKSHDYPAT